MKVICSAGKSGSDCCKDCMKKSLLLPVGGAFHALRPEDLRRSPAFFVGVAASFFR